MQKVLFPFLLTCIIFIAVFFRVYHIASVPPAPSIDEVSIGWNAYSILKTGKDEYGTPFPLLLRAYDDYRPALYVYLVIPFIQVIGLSVTAVRMPSVLLSILSVIATYGIVNVLSGKKNVAALAALFLAVSPWHIYISRLGHEVNAGLSFLLFGIYFFLAYIQTSKKLWMIISSAIFLSLSFGSYQSEKIVVPLITLGLVLLYRKQVFINKKNILYAVITGLIFCIPTLISTFSTQGLIRFSGTSAFSPTSSIYLREQDKFVEALQKGNTPERILYSPKLRILKIFISNYSDHFKLSWLFTGGMYDSHKVPYTGVLYVWEGIFVVIGLFSLLYQKKYSIILTTLLLLCSGFIPAAITTQTPHALRSFTVLPSFQILAAFGCMYVLSRFNKKISYIVGVCICLIIFKTVYTMGYNYFVVFPMTQSESFSYALGNVFPYVVEHQKEYKSIVFSNILGTKDFRYPSYMFFLFYTRFNPSTYIAKGGTVSGGFDAVHKFGSYEFRPVSAEDRSNTSLYITDVEKNSSGKKIQYVGKYLDGNPGIQVYSYE